MSDRHQELLHRFVDGELSAAEAEEWEGACAETPDLRADAEDFAQIGHILREQLGAEVQEADFAGFMVGISAQLETESPSLRPEPVRAQPGAIDSIKAWWTKNWTPVLVSAAAAAAVSLWVSLGTQDEGALANDNAVLVDAVSNEGSKTVLISMPTETEDSTIIWLLEEEADEQPTLGEDPI